MIFSVPRLIADASRLMTLYPGGIVCTGSVGRVLSGAGDARRDQRVRGV